MLIEKRGRKGANPYWVLSYEGQDVAICTANSLADAALIARYLDGATLPDAECIRAQELLKEGDE